MAGKYHYTVSANFCAIEADSIEELNELLSDFVSDPTTAALVAQFKAVTSGQTVAVAPVVDTHAPAIAAAQAALGATVIQQQVAAPAAPVALAGPELVSDKYGNQYTYGLAEAPALPDGRGQYIKKAWTSQKGKRLTAWVDPSKGPKPCVPGAVEAELIWI